MVKKLDKVDVVIVGSGWAGGIPAAELSKAGYQVVCLERGKDRSTVDFVGSKDELRYTRRHELAQDLSKQALTFRNTVDQKASPIRMHYGYPIFDEGTGGTSVHWSGWSYRWLPFDFEIRSKIIEKYGEDRIPEDMTIQDWGITYDELEAYYDKWEKTAGISDEVNPLGPKRSDEYPNPPMKESPSIRMFQDAAKELGYHPFRMPSATISQQYENPDGETINACVYCAFCSMYGCDFGAKADPIVTVLKTARKTGNFELRNNANVRRVLHDGKKATGVLYIDPQTRQEYEQPADLVVLGAFFSGNTRLMMLSEIGEQFDPKTGKGVIGKNYTSHYTALGGNSATGFFEDKKFNTFAGAGALGAVLDDFNGDNIDNSKTDFLHGFNLSIFQDGAGAIANNRVPSGTPLWGNEFKEKSLHYAYRHLTVSGMQGTLPRQHNYMDLDPTYKDAYGDPLLRITAKVTDQELNMAKQISEKAKEIMEKMGADIVDVPEVSDAAEISSASINTHSAGGVIMGDDPETSAVNNYSQVWDMENLFVVGGSSFPHFGNSNPTETIGAFAYRAAEGMIEYLKNDGGLLVEGGRSKKTYIV
ncbi:GMC family oxidoreductase [Virgibacillus sp. W0181]|uniref:GMC family oxidoreductase n=1 Tax=Virgibacillus sp. W0181 TaxID=3391581 RepID=UPI003F465281